MSALDRAKETSTVLASLERAIGDSWLPGVLGNRYAEARETARTITDWWPASRIGRLIQGTIAVFARSIEASYVSDLASTIERSVRGSFLYRWLTAEPEPRVIAIDLRETKTGGPVITILDWVIGLLAYSRPASTTDRIFSDVSDYAWNSPIRVTSVVLLAVGLVLQIVLGTLGGTGLIVTAVAMGFAVLGLRNDTSWDELRETNPVRLLVAALEPPEPPKEFDRVDERTTPADDGTGQSSEE